MFQLNLNSADIAVAVDHASGRPREIKAHGERLTVSALESVRDETAAYPVASGPRTVFVVRAGGRRYRLVHLIRDRRWTLDELEVRANGFSTAA
jgi:hypothetical protein